MRLDGRIALVTGSSTGIGEAIARRFAEAGARIMVHGLDAAETEAVADQIRHRGGEAASLLGDLADGATCRRLVEQTVATFGGIDILINNAAWKLRDDLDGLESEVFDRLIAINLRAPLLLVQAAMPHFRTVGGGSVINIGSMNAYCGERNQLSYSISKGGLMTMCRNLADAYGPEGLRINHFNVGWVVTANEYRLKVAEGYPADWPSHVPRQYAPSGRLLRPEEIAHFALAFVCTEGGFVNGQVLELEQYPLIGRSSAGLTAITAAAAQPA